MDAEDATRGLFIKNATSAHQCDVPWNFDSHQDRSDILFEEAVKSLGFNELSQDDVRFNWCCCVSNECVCVQCGWWWIDSHEDFLVVVSTSLYKTYTM